MQAVEDVAHYKQEHALPVLDQGREQEVLDRNVNYIENEKYKDSYLSMMKDMMRISRNYQQSLLHKEVVGYQGVEGAFSSIAAKHLFPHYKKRSYTSFEDVIKAVISGEIEYGVLPVENSYSGEVGEVIDLLMKYEQVYIQQIYDLKNLSKFVRNQRGKTRGYPAGIFKRSGNFTIEAVFRRKRL